MDPAEPDLSVIATVGTGRIAEHASFPTHGNVRERCVVGYHVLHGVGADGGSGSSGRTQQSKRHSRINSERQRSRYRLRRRRRQRDARGFGAAEHGSGKR